LGTSGASLFWGTTGSSVTYRTGITVVGVLLSVAKEAFIAGTKGPALSSIAGAAVFGAVVAATGDKLFCSVILVATEGMDVIAKWNNTVEAKWNNTVELGEVVERRIGCCVLGTSLIDPFAESNGNGTDVIPYIGPWLVKVAVGTILPNPAGASVD
jgi:hypothetical protein